MTTIREKVGRHGTAAAVGGGTAATVIAIVVTLQSLGLLPDRSGGGADEAIAALRERVAVLEARVEKLEGVGGP